MKTHVGRLHGPGWKIERESGEPGLASDHPGSRFKRNAPDGNLRGARICTSLYR